MPRKPQVRNEPPPAYPLDREVSKEAEDLILAHAAQILESRIKHDPVDLASSRYAKQWLRSKLAGHEREVFLVVHLDKQHRLIEAEELFYGTLDGSMVHPREVVKSVLKRNAGAVLFVHNHPSGVAEPSQADIGITRRLKAALDLIDVRVLDHLVVGDAEVVSLAERGLM